MRFEPQLQLFLLPFAGGSAAHYRELIACLDPRVEAFPVEYAGRGTRSRESFIVDYDAFLKDVSSTVLRKRDSDLPYAILGYSMGGNIVYHLIVKKLLNVDPLHLFLCARDCVAQPSPSLQHYRLSDADFLEEIRKLGGFDERLLQNDRFLQIYMKPIREDYRVLGQFRYSETDRKLPCDTTVLYSEQDTPFSTVKGWNRLVDGKVDYYALGGNHFFIKQSYSEMADIINAKLQCFLER